jgi:hypothetical protein
MAVEQTAVGMRIPLPEAAANEARAKLEEVLQQAEG